MRHTSAPPTSNIDPFLGAGDEAEKFSPQFKMGLVAQEQLTKSNEARDVQNRARHENVQLKAIVLQETSEERVNWESSAS